MACEMYGRHPAQELGIVDELARLDLLLAAWGVRKLEADKEERRRIRLRRELNRELALMCALAASGKEIPPIPPETENEDARETGGDVHEQTGKVRARSGAPILASGTEGPPVQYEVEPIASG
jgi:hypothetical protein